MITDELLFRFLNGETSRKENRIINDWLRSKPDHKYRLSNLREIFESSGQPAVNSEDLIRDWGKIVAAFQEKPVIVMRHSPLMVRMARVAAVIVLLAGSALLWFNQTNTHIIRNQEQVAQSVSLPDGTLVDLGPGARLVYGREFLEGVRVVRLTGEACFEVTSDPGHPFTVIAGLAKVRVTGTRFVVNAPPGSKEIEVAVKSGNVLFYNSEKMERNAFRVGLVAGEIGIFYPGLKRMDKTRDPNFQSAP